MTTCVFISSSDNTKDVLDLVFSRFFDLWPDCPYPVYVGLNQATPAEARFRVVRSVAAGWRVELAAQIAQLSHDRVLLLLDDFLLLAPVRTALLMRLDDEARAKRIDYLRLLPLERSLWQFPARALARLGDDVERISPTRPYYGALQIVNWSVEHLQATLHGAGSIWDLEHRSLPGSRHYAITGAAPIRYRHVVEKGRWMSDAGRLLQRVHIAPAAGNRPVASHRQGARRLVSLAWFAIAGYSTLRLRRWWRRAVRSTPQ